jgi:hypothetical protein
MCILILYVAVYFANFINVNNKEMKFKMIKMTNFILIILGPENILPHQTYTSKSFIVSALDEFQYTE